MSSTTISRLGGAGRGIAAMGPRLRRMGSRIVSASGSWRRFATPMGVVAVLGGFAVVIQSWWDSTTTPDARVELQDVISAIGGAALVIAGVLLIVGEVFMSLRTSGAQHMERIAAALTQMASGGGAQAEPAGAPVSPSSVVLASHASYHAPSCDLVLGRDGIRVTTLSDAHAQGLTPCRACLGGGAG